jgi:hypothetical protein
MLLDLDVRATLQAVDLVIEPLGQADRLVGAPYGCFPGELQPIPRLSLAERGGALERGGGERRMVNAYVLIQEDLAGPLRRHRHGQGSRLDELGKVVVARIQVVAGVTRTLTCIVIVSSPSSGTPIRHLSRPSRWSAAGAVGAAKRVGGTVRWRPRDGP